MMNILLSALSQSKMSQRVWKHCLQFCAFAFVLSSCSGSDGNDGTIVDPDLHPDELPSTGRLLSIDGAGRHIAYSYDGEGRVMAAEEMDSDITAVVKQLDAYRYEGDRIYIEHREYREFYSGERDYDYSRDFIRDDTLFLVSGRVDSVAGAMRGGRNCFFYRFRYNERGELVHVKNENIMRDYKGRLMEKPWYAELYTIDWQDDNVSRSTLVDPIRRDTTVWSYQYDPLLGSFTGSDPRFVLVDFVPLMQDGYFGAPAKNLMHSVETGDYLQQNEYTLDAEGRIDVMKCTTTRGEHTFSREYRIRWYDASASR